MNDISTANPHIRTSKSRWILFGAVCVTSASAVVLYAKHTFVGADSAPGVGTSATIVDDQLSAVRSGPHVVFRSTAPGPSFGRVMLVALNDQDGPRCETALTCDVLYGSRRGGICLQSVPGIYPSFQCMTFDEEFVVTHDFRGLGLPSRARISRDGRTAAITAFVTGDSYNAAGFSTRSTLIDVHSGTIIDDLERFHATIDGGRSPGIDSNYWGVTFAATRDEFYATLLTGGRYFLVSGQVSTRTMQAVRDGVECPSLSPDETRIAYKHRVFENSRWTWRLRVLRLNSSAEDVAVESRSVDDQAEWLDNDHVLYTLLRDTSRRDHSDVWSVRADGTEAPRLFLRDASYPCVVRP